MFEQSHFENFMSRIDKCKKTRLVNNQRDNYFEAMPEICVERPRLITKFYKNNILFGKERVSILEKAKLYRYVLENRTPVVRHEYIYTSRGVGKNMRKKRIEDRSPFAGSTTSKFKGVPLFPEFLAMSLWPELWSISKRKQNPYHLDKENAKILNRDVYPFWMDESILERTRARCEKNGEDPKGAELMQRLVFFIASKANCISHTIPDFSRVVNQGLAGIIKKAKQEREDATDPDQKEFYAAVAEVLKGIVAYSRNLSSRAREMAREEKHPDKKTELNEIANIYQRVPNGPARTFREGLTSVWVCWTAIHIENPNIGLSLGRIDQLLYDLYAKDIRNNPGAEGDALELICQFWLKLGDHVPMMPEAGEQLFGGTGSNQAITIGGVKAGEGGKPVDAVNDLTYLMLKATELMELRDPNLNARYYPGIHQPEYLEQLCETNLKTGATPALHNDRAVIKALTGRGDSEAEALDYGIVGCVEPVSNGRAYTASPAILLNLASVLELTLYNGCHRHTGLKRENLISKETGDPAGFPGFKRFKEAFQEQLEWMADVTTNFNDELGKTHQRFHPTPLLSALFEGPMEKGRDIVRGGARINGHGVTIIGLADVADSLNAIEKVIYLDKKADFPQLIDAMDKNFEKEGKMLRERLKGAPKYGDESNESQANVAWLVNTLHDSFDKKSAYRDGKYRVGYWTMTNHAGFGRLTGALPSGRKKGENFASGVTPVSGAVPTLTPVLNSVAALPAGSITNGMALNIKYTKPGEENEDVMRSHFKATVKAFFKEEVKPAETGGMEIQFNIRDHQRLVEEMKHPRENSHLLVRVSGYTAYFGDLNKQMQKEIIDRTEYDISGGRPWRIKTFEPVQGPSDGNGVDFSWIKLIPGVGRLTDSLLELLLSGMKHSLLLYPGFKRNIENYKGRFLFQTKDKKKEVNVSVVFDDGNMEVVKNPGLNDAYDVEVFFRDEAALLEYLLSGDQDILNVMLKNDVEIKKNANHIFRFGFLAKDLERNIMGLGLV